MNKLLVFPIVLILSFQIFSQQSINRQIQVGLDKIYNFNWDGGFEAFNSVIKKYPDDYWARQAKFKMEDAIWEHEYKAVLR